MSPFNRPLFVLGGALMLPLAARAQPMSELSSSQTVPELAARPITQAEFAQAATGQIGFLASLKSWRDTLRASGPRARRDFVPLSVGGQKLGLSLGQVAAPIVGSGAGIAAKWSALEIGTTAQPQALTDVLNRFDGFLTGEEIKPTDATQMTWLRAKPLQNKTAQVELSIADGRRDMLAGDGEKWLGGLFQTAKAHLNLPAKWSLNSDFTRAQLDNQDAAASSWGFDAAGPISHPWGQAQARANFRNVDSGFASLVNPTAAVGAASGGVEIAQDVAHGPLSGRVKVAANKRQRAKLQTAKKGDEIEADNTQSEAQMRLKLMPNLIVTTSGRAIVADTTRALTDAPQNDLLTPDEARQWSQQLAGDLGLELRFSKALSFAVSTGTSRARLQNASGQTWNDGPSSDENRRTMELHHQRGASDLRLRLAQRSRLDALSNSSSSNGNPAAVSQWSLEATRPLLLGMHLKTIVDVARDAQADLSSRRIEAQLQLARAARFDARYREGTLPPGLLSDGWSSAFEAPNMSLSKQWAARLNTGSAASAGGGFGLALEYARGVGTGGSDSWRVGVQFK